MMQEVCYRPVLSSNSFSIIVRSSTRFRESASLPPTTRSLSQKTSAQRPQGRNS